MFAIGFFINLGARPANQVPYFFICFSCHIIKCSEKECFSVNPRVCNFALIISKGWVIVVANIPEVIPATILSTPKAFNY